MSIITGNFPVVKDREQVGTVSVSQNGLLTVFDCACTFKSRDVLRLAAVCAGRFVPLGVLVPSPDSGTLHLKKSYSKNALADIGFTGADAFHLISPGQLQNAGPEAPPPPPAVTNAAAEVRTPAFDVAATEAVPAAAVVTAPLVSPVAEPASDASTAADIQAVSKSDVSAEKYEADDALIPNEEPPFVLTQRGPEPVAETEPVPETQPVPEPEPEPELKPDNFQRFDAEPAEENPAPQSLTDKLLSALLEMTSNKAPDTDEPAAEPAAAAITAPDGWQYAEIPAALFVDPDISKTCQDVTNALVRTEEDHVLLAVPISPEEPFSMMPVFCFGTPRQIDGSEYIVFKIKDGYLTL